MVSVLVLSEETHGPDLQTSIPSMQHYKGLIMHCGLLWSFGMAQQIGSSVNSSLWLHEVAPALKLFIC